jgi:hypothetical protein
MGERLATEFDADAIITPRLRFSDDRIWTLVRLLSGAVNDPDPSTQLYGDGLTAAITARLFADPPELGADGKGLAPWQLRRIVEYLDAQLPQRVDLAHPARAGAADRQPRLARAGGRGHRLCRCGAFWAHIPKTHRSNAGGVAARPEKLITIP